MEKKPTIGKYAEVWLEAPASVAIQLDIINLSNVNFPRSLYAALGVCWRGKGSPDVSYARCGYDPAAYGGIVLDKLIKREDGTTVQQIIEAGGDALTLVKLKYGSLSAVEVQGTVDFIEEQAL
tara:strand:+ start:2322 stop:2690 length:369 start_codon:yes stop_codon:yes gene_type:complete